MRIAPLVTRSPQTGAVRHVTEDLLRNVYLAPQTPAIDLAEYLGHIRGPWSESHAVAPDATTKAVASGLLAIARSTSRLEPEEIDVSQLSEGRARMHLSALKDLWTELATLPEPLATWAHVLRCSESDALEPLPLLDPRPCPFADPAETALMERLLDHHGNAPAEVLPVWAARQPSCTGEAAGALGAVQSGLGRDPGRLSPDGSIACFGLRDPRDESDFAATLAQRMLDDGSLDAPDQIGLLVPDDAAYGLVLPEAFGRLGLPLSGLPSQPPMRDNTGEILALLLVLLQGPAPRTALASLYVSPQMPWPRDTGRRMAREVIDQGWSRTAKELSGPGRDLLDALRPCTTREQLFARLGAIARAAPAASLMPRIVELRSARGDALDWPLLHRLAAPRPVAEAGPDRFVEGISLFTESALPWRPVRHLIVLGLAGRQWPRPIGANPFFTEGEVAQIRKQTGLGLLSRRDGIVRGLELFRRQICAATEGLTLLVPACDLRGERLALSTGFTLIAHKLGAKEPADIVRDIRAEAADARPFAAIAHTSVPLGGLPELPRDGLIRIQRGIGSPNRPGVDLLRVREDEAGQRVPQSPSRLETLIVSPLAWLLDELDARDRTWAPEQLDVITLGNILHRVLELTFPKGARPLDAQVLTARVHEALELAIDRHAPWLSDPSWAAERLSLVREAEKVAAAWSDFLAETGAEVLHTEIALAGDHHGLLLRGKADCLLGLPDGRILVVDHKRTSTKGRRDRMTKGWDLQVALYRAMLERPTEDTELTRRVAAGAQVVTAYHTLLDATVLTDPGGAGLPLVEAASNDPSMHALDHLTQVLAEVGAGTIRLNRADDAKRFEKERGIKAYALENEALVAAYTLPAEDQE